MPSSTNADRTSHSDLSGLIRSVSSDRVGQRGVGSAGAVGEGEILEGEKGIHCTPQDFYKNFTLFAVADAKLQLSLSELRAELKFFEKFLRVTRAQKEKHCRKGLDS